MLADPIVQPRAVLQWVSVCADQLAIVVLWLTLALVAGVLGLLIAVRFELRNELRGLAHW